MSEVCSECKGKKTVMVHVNKNSESFKGHFAEHPCPSCTDKAPINEDVREAFEKFWDQYEQEHECVHEEGIKQIAFEVYNSTSSRIQELESENQFLINKNIEFGEQVSNLLESDDKLKAENEALRCCGNCEHDNPELESTDMECTGCHPSQGLHEMWQPKENN